MHRLTALPLLLLPLAGPVQAGPAEEGEALFTAGARPGAPAPRATASRGATMPATALPCSGCHGADGGGGRIEAGVTPPPVLWSSLSRPAPGRPAYDAPSVLRAVSQGLAPDGRGLDPVMPRYALTMQDGQALLAYLRALDARGVPGVEEDLVSLGLLVPAGPLGQGFAAAFGQALSAAAPEGVFGRRITLRQMEVADWREAPAATRRLLDDGVLALASALPGEANEGALAVAAGARVPILSARAGLASSPLSFALLPGAVEEGVAALRLAPEPGRTLILVSGAAAEQRLAEAIAGRVGQTAEADPRIVTPAVLPGAMAGSTGILLLLPPSRLGEIAATLRQGQISLFVPGAVGGAGIQAAAAAAGQPVVVALGVPLEAGEGMAARRFAASGAARLGLPGRLGHAAGEVFVEAMRRSGRRLTRERLASVLEGPEAFETGSLPQQRLSGAARADAGRIAILRMDGAGTVTRAAGTATAE
ncbi:c-type cytochrome [Roseomonas marmotae]|uniref:Cytochrome c domain-containing protein n=1 Tax=Roseomonas marmotae TaxID=2768161 RepID=A0ABS3KC20_9PROT|nr:hypothetical protein [Roseomonas marmotae]MBO1075016.1 hypothetical protein [Roseomonas marmotae]QTI79948.1 hypothetical protein IAI58_03970 [Roseomonas marmotae]